MRNNVGRALVRWMHIVAASAILVYVYAAEVQAIAIYDFAVKVLIIPATIISGLWLWKGHVVKSLLFSSSRKITVLFFLALCLPSSGFEQIEEVSLKLEILNVEKTGTLYVTFCKNAGEWSDNGSFNFEFATPAKGKNTFTVSIPKGVYAIAMYQDNNGNEELDTNFFGVPKEPYAFSNNIKPKFSEPSFEECKFNFTTAEQTVSIKLIN